MGSVKQMRAIVVGGANEQGTNSRCSWRASLPDLAP